MKKLFFVLLFIPFLSCQPVNNTVSLITGFSMTPDRTDIFPGETVSITVNVVDSDEYEYKWSVLDGTFSSDTEKTFTWTAPNEEKSVRIFVSVKQTSTKITETASLDLTITLLAPTPTPVQTPTPTASPSRWSSVYVSASDTKDLTWGVAETVDGGTISIANMDNGSIKIPIVMKHDKFGNVMWRRQFDTGQDHSLYNIIRLSDNSFAILGTVKLDGNTDFDLWLIKLDSNGDYTWHRVYRGDSTETHGNLIQAGTGYMLCGYTSSFSSVGTDIWVLSITDIGDIAWQKKYGAAGNDQASDIIKFSDTEYLIGGQTTSYASGDSQQLLLKINTTGTITMQKHYGVDAVMDYLSEIGLTTTNDIIMCGHTQANTREDISLVKVSSTGTPIWQKSFGGNDYESSFSLVMSYDNNILLTGFSSSVTISNYDLITAKFNLQGGIVWQKAYKYVNDSIEDVGRRIVEAENHDILIAGDTISTVGKQSDSWIFRTAPDGSTGVINYEDPAFPCADYSITSGDMSLSASDTTATIIIPTMTVTDL